MGNRDLDDKTMARVERHETTLKSTREAKAARDAWLRQQTFTVGEPTPERLEKDEVEKGETTQTKRTLTRVETQMVLDRYFKRGQISKLQYDAGQRFYRTWSQAGGLARITASWNIKIDAVCTDGVLHQVDAYEKVSGALRYVGKQLSQILVGVCLMDQAAREWALTRDDPPETGIVVLRLALDRLAEYYAKSAAPKKA